MDFSMDAVAGGRSKAIDIHGGNIFGGLGQDIVQGLLEQPKSLPSEALSTPMG